MASSLWKLMSRVSTQAKNIALTTPRKLVSVPSLQFSVFKNDSLLLNKELLTAARFEPMRQNAVPHKSFHTTPVSNVTLELKQWREHRVINRFYRLHWGAWIRCFGGRFRRLYQKKDSKRWMLKQHVFCTKSQCRKLDTLVTAKWREPKYYADSPYEPYHVRTNCTYFPSHKKFYP
ncbi:mitochondrial 54S ribosomal protein YmL35 [Bulinus truncatus]|nr:mitochondrial 54S ribosomal protein YmL35 [Bulinus truncatus]